MAPVLQPESLILASASPRRRQLLSDAGYRFEVVEPPIDEPQSTHPHVVPALYAESLAFFKASSVAGKRADACILAADTIAVVEGEIIGKPADRQDAYRILRRLSGTTHFVITGVVLLHPATGRRLMRHAASGVTVRRLSDEAVRRYLDTGAWCGKAGAYGVQDRDDPFVEKIDGSFTNVVGLPMEMLAEMFADWTGAARGEAWTSS